MDTRLRDMENKGMTGHGQNDFTEVKLCLTNLVVLHKVRALMDKGRAMAFISLDMCKPYDTVPHDIFVSLNLVSKLHVSKRHEFDNRILSGYGVNWIVMLKELQSTAQSPSRDRWCSSGVGIRTIGISHLFQQCVQWD